MTINMDKYVKIRSRIGGVVATPRRELILRIFTPSTLASSVEPLEFTTADAVKAYFGIDSDEYKRAVAYFKYISPSLSRPQKISFARDKTAVSKAQLYGEKRRFDMTSIKQQKTTLTVYFDRAPTSGAEGALTTAAMDFSKVTTLAQVASTLQAGLQGITGSTVPSANYFKGMTVAYDATNSRFIVTSGDNSEIRFRFPTDSKLAVALGIDKENAISIGGVTATADALSSLEASIDSSNNFGTFIFTRQLTTDENLQIAQYNNDLNVEYEFTVAVTVANAETTSRALFNIGGVSLVLVSDENTEYDEVLPAAIKAATRYDREDSTVSYMYRELEDLSPKVIATDLSDTLDNLRVNYYGQTQSAGSKVSFYQRGVMMGLNTDLIDQNIYANEQWLKDDIRNEYLTLMRIVDRVQSSDLGVNKLVNALQTSIDRAVSNGVIALGKPLTDRQKQYIAEQSNDESAYTQVQNLGYWYKCDMSSYQTDDGRTEWRGTYVLIYSKDDVIRRVDGDDLLI